MPIVRSGKLRKRKAHPIALQSIIVDALFNRVGGCGGVFTYTCKYGMFRMCGGFTQQAHLYCNVAYLYLCMYICSPCLFPWLKGGNLIKRIKKRAWQG